MKNFSNKVLDSKNLSNKRKAKSQVKDLFFRGLINGYIETIFSGNALD